MKIIFLESIHNFGGAGISTIELAARLLQHGHNIKIVDFWGAIRAHTDACKTAQVPLVILDKQDSPMLLSGNKLLFTLLSRVKYFFKFLHYRTKFKMLVDEVSPDIICVNNIKALSIVPVSKNYKIVFFGRGWMLPELIGPMSKWAMKKKVSFYWVVSQATRHMVYANGLAALKDIFVIHNAVDIKVIQAIKRKVLRKPMLEDCVDRPFTLLHCGTFIKTKGQHVALDVLKRLVEEGVNVNLTLVGMVSKSINSQKYYQSVLSKISDYDLGNKVKVVKNDSDVLQYFAEADVLIHPSSTEGLPRVVLEAMAMGKPVIGNAVGGMIDIISNNFTGFLTNFNNINEYVDIIEKLINNENMYKRVSYNASNLIKSNYSIDNQMKEFDKSMEALDV